MRQRPAGDRRGSSRPRLSPSEGWCAPGRGPVDAGPERETALLLGNSTDLFVSPLLPKWQKIKAPGLK